VVSGGKAYIIEDMGGYTIEWKLLKNGDLIGVYGVEFIYWLNNGKIYRVEFRRPVNPSYLLTGCYPIFYTGENTVYECGKGVERFIERHAKAISEISDEYKYLYTILRKALPRLFSTQ